MATGLSPLKGVEPVSISYITTPSEYRSLRPSTGLPWACSGEKYVAVPMTEPVRVRLASAPADMAVAMPKSATLA